MRSAQCLDELAYTSCHMLIIGWEFMQPNFAADRTLGKLVKWLRLMGFDTVFESDATACRFRAFSDSDRIYLTRVRQINLKMPSARLIHIDDDDIESQLKQVVSQLNLKYSMLEPYSRCLRCNDRLAEISRSETFGAVPDYVWENQTAFRQCPGCRRIFWPGSHVDRSRKRLSQLFNG